MERYPLGAHTTVRAFLNNSVAWALAVWPATVTAQTYDSSAVRVIAASALQVLAADSRIPMLSGAQSPWRITIDSSSQEWRTAASRIHLLLSSRPPVATDTLIEFLTFGPIQIRGDSLFTSFDIGSTRRCPGNSRSATTSAHHSIVAFRQAGSWIGAKTLEVVIGDGFCGPGRSGGT